MKVKIKRRNLFSLTLYEERDNVIIEEKEKTEKIDSINVLTTCYVLCDMQKERIKRRIYELKQGDNK